ncbi:SIMPL domain-containing protein [Klenkia sp. LSe6-5]|uniref:SIMPL domain-containing protein n=1 Tax=Klenkia sesuvii TaxID=3103137 RepID=A0ABU8DPW6_9ACTN
MTEPTPRVVVRGETTLRVPPSHATLSLTAEARDRHRDRALVLLGDVQRTVADLLAEHAALVTRSATAAVGVHAEHSDRQRVTGYRATVTTQVRVDDVDRVGELAVAAAGLDGCSLWGPSWQLDRDDPAWARARTEAIGEAVARARGYAEAVGSTLTGLVELRDVGTGAVSPAMMMAGSARSAVRAAPELDLEPALQEVHGAVEAVFLISAPNLEEL